ncbi:MAG: chromate transporter [Bacteroidaceae bacterium]|nr:chromate transporter [Bacteroidaceae bacterium]
MIFLHLFKTFFLIGLFGFGGGYGMLSLIQNDVVEDNHWVTSGEFTDMVAISQMTPGPIGINSATYCGYTAVHKAFEGEMSGGTLEAVSTLGSVVATFAVVLPSLILMLLISMMFLKYMNTPMVQNVFKTLRPVVVGLLASAVLLLMTKENFSSYTEDRFRFICSCLLFAVSFVCVWRGYVGPIKMICACAIFGAVFF